VEAAAADAPWLHVPAAEAAAADAPWLHVPAAEADAPFEAVHAAPTEAALADIFALHSAAVMPVHEAETGQPVAALTAVAAVAFADLEAAALAYGHLEASAVIAAADAWVCLDLSHATASETLPAIRTASAVKTSRACFMSHLRGHWTAPGNTYAVVGSRYGERYRPERHQACHLHVAGVSLKCKNRALRGPRTRGARRENTGPRRAGGMIRALRAARR
jgi:hypothetical protein